MAPKKPVTKADLMNLYAARRFLHGKTQERLGLKIPFEIYFQDPSFAKRNVGAPEFDQSFVPWEPGISHGPTSARFAVFDYDGDTGVLTPPATWNPSERQFLDENKKKIDLAALQSDPHARQAHQVHVWVLLQRALEFFESGFGLGRTVSWAFEGNRLIVAPHAGNGRNAFYDRQSKSLQFYYFDSGPERIYTCLSADIVNHEFAHAVLDGIRPHYVEAAIPETAAFHEFVGDLTAILITFRNNDFRKYLVESSKGDLGTDNALNRLAEEFGKAVHGRPYLRTARNDRTMSELAGEQRPHLLSEVLTGAIFEIIIEISRYYIKERGRTAPEAFWDTIQRMQQMAIQPLDLLPPCDVTFKDYARAVLRMEQIANPTDPDGYRDLMLRVFLKREIFDEQDVAELTAPGQVFERPVFDVFHEVEEFSSSRAQAYRFLDDNRTRLFIPSNVDVVVSDLYVAHKLTRQARRLPKQIIMQYVWREEVEFDHERFGGFQGRKASLLCGGTLAFDHEGNVLSWVRKPGTIFCGSGQREGDDVQDRDRGQIRKEAFLDAIAARIKAGRIGDLLGSPSGFVSTKAPPLVSREIDGALRFELTPHFGIDDDSKEEMSAR